MVIMYCVDQIIDKLIGPSKLPGPINLSNYLPKCLISIVSDPVYL